jgi:hypothetical protein
VIAMNNFETKYMKFEKDNSYTGKTESWYVLSKGNGIPLANVKWYNPWSQYVMFPEEDTLFNYSCLDEIKTFLAALNKEYRMSKA